MTTITLSANATESTALSELRDPFNANCIDRITMWIRKDLWNRDKVIYEARIAFRNGATSGEQDLIAPDFPSLVKKVETFVNGLDPKP